MDCSFSWHDLLYANGPMLNPNEPIHKYFGYHLGSQIHYLSKTYCPLNATDIDSTDSTDRRGWVYLNVSPPKEDGSQWTNDAINKVYNTHNYIYKNSSLQEYVNMKQYTIQGLVILSVSIK